MELIRTEHGLILCTKHELYGNDLAKYENAIDLVCTMDKAKHNANALIDAHGLIHNHSTMCSSAPLEVIDLSRFYVKRI